MMADECLAALLDEEEIVFEPVAGAFDVAAIAVRLGSLGFSFRDAHDPAMFVIAASEAEREAFQAERQARPGEGYPSALLVRLEAARVVVSPVGLDGYAGLSAEILAWLAAGQPCRIFNDHGTDVTEVLRG